VVFHQPRRRSLCRNPHSILSWLLRKHWESHLLGFAGDGLTLEHGHKYRAYFEANGREARTVVWNSPQRRGNRRDVVKKRRDGVRGWFENEGFGYEIVDMGGLWCASRGRSPPRNVQH
jgi:hypothetical protein